MSPCRSCILPDMCFYSAVRFFCEYPKLITLVDALCRACQARPRTVKCSYVTCSYAYRVFYDPALHPRFPFVPKNRSSSASTSTADRRRRRKLHRRQPDGVLLASHLTIATTRRLVKFRSVQDLMRCSVQTVFANQHRRHGGIKCAASNIL